MLKRIESNLTVNQKMVEEQYDKELTTLEELDIIEKTDNEAVSGAPSKCAPFVRNRGLKIQDIGKKMSCELRFVSGELDRADIVSRGMSASKLKSLWVQGPEFIRGPVDEWPHTRHV